MAPGVETPGYCRSSLRDKTNSSARAWRRNAKSIRLACRRHLGCHAVFGALRGSSRGPLHKVKSISDSVTLS
jgi:hypothetical protein